MTVNRPLTLEDAIHKAANYAKAEEEFASYERQHAAEKKPPSNTWIRPVNARATLAGYIPTTLRLMSESNTPLLITPSMSMKILRREVPRQKSGHGTPMRIAVSIKITAMTRLIVKPCARL